MPGDPAASVTIRRRDTRHDVWVRRALVAHWGSTLVVSRGRAHQADRLPGFVAEQAGEPTGLLTFELRDAAFEVVTLHSEAPRRGIGLALLAHAREHARGVGAARLWLVTTNDNTGAIAFYRAAGLQLAGVHRGALAASRALKPGIPLRNADGVPIEDEWEFELRLDHATPHTPSPGRGAE